MDSGPVVQLSVAFGSVMSLPRCRLVGFYSQHHCNAYVAADL